MGLMFLILLGVLTSTLAYCAAKRVRPASVRPMKKAFLGFFEWVGSFAVFLSANLALGVLVILVVRKFTPRFVSLYELENLLLLVLSAAQAFVFRYWWSAD